MELLKNQRAWRKWAKEQDFTKDVNVEPTTYPCWAYTVVEHWGYQELAPVYIYRAELESMLKAMGED